MNYKEALIMEVYVSTDVEADGPIPGLHSMLSFASAAFLVDKTLIDTFYATLETLPGASAHPETLRWWKEHPKAWEASRKDPQPPEVVMTKYVEWLKKLPGKPVFVAYPATYDFMFIYWYLIRFTDESPFSHAALDMKTLAMAILGTEYRQTTKRHMPREWFGSIKHSHIALDDAIEQGILFCNMLQVNEELHHRK